ncbi:MAG: hypothetical protein C0514_06635 [Candidatus Puniceispirillum sp.]|nr:hypothetical protein [Candidatus Puniceispirillum sp.]
MHQSTKLITMAYGILTLVWQVPTYASQPQLKQELVETTKPSLGRLQPRLSELDLLIEQYRFTYGSEEQVPLSNEQKDAVKLIVTTAVTQDQIPDFFAILEACEPNTDQAVAHILNALIGSAQDALSCAMRRRPNSIPTLVNARNELSALSLLVSDAWSATF